MKSLRHAALSIVFAASAAAQDALPDVADLQGWQLNARCSALVQAILLEAAPRSVTVPREVVTFLPELHKWHFLMLVTNVHIESGRYENSDSDNIELSALEAKVRVEAVMPLYREALLDKDGLSEDGRLQMLDTDAVHEVINRDLSACVRDLPD